MADTGAPYFIPYVEPTDLVRDYPAADEASADAIAAALDGIPVLAGIGSNVVSTTFASTFTTSSTTLVDVTGVTVTITPTTATSKILVLTAYAQGRNSNATNGVRLRVMRDSTLIGNIIGQDSSTANAAGSGSAIQLDSPETTSPVVYKVQTGNDGGGTVSIFGVSLTVIEVAA